MLLSTPRKVLDRILLKRMKVSANQYLRENQAGLRKVRSCPDQNNNRTVIGMEITIRQIHRLRESIR